MQPTGRGAGEEGGLEKEAVDKPLPAQRSHEAIKEPGMVVTFGVQRNLSLTEAAGQGHCGAPLDSPLTHSWGRWPEEITGSHPGEPGPPSPGAQVLFWPLSGDLGRWGRAGWEAQSFRFISVNKTED